VKQNESTRILTVDIGYTVSQSGRISF